jgi:hypothetical protein
VNKNSHISFFRFIRNLFFTDIYSYKVIQKIWIYHPWYYKICNEQHSRKKTVRTRCGKIWSEKSVWSIRIWIRSDLFFFKSQIDSTRSEPNLTRDQMTFNPIKIYQKTKKTQHINWSNSSRPQSDLTRSDFFQKIKLISPTRPEPESNLTRPITTSSHYYNISDNT